MRHPAESPARHPTIGERSIFCDADDGGRAHHCVPRERETAAPSAQQGGQAHGRQAHWPRRRGHRPGEQATLTCTCRREALHDRHGWLAWEKKHALVVGLLEEEEPVDTDSPPAKQQKTAVPPAVVSPTTTSAGSSSSALSTSTLDDGSDLDVDTFDYTAIPVDCLDRW